MVCSSSNGVQRADVIQFLDSRLGGAVEKLKLQASRTLTSAESDCDLVWPARGALLPHGHYLAHRRLSPRALRLSSSPKPSFDSPLVTATGDMPTYQIRAPTTGLPQGVVMAASPGSLHSPQQLAEEATRKRELRLMKNREAARECRRKKKEYVKCLENRVAVLENQNKTLIEELKALKDLYCHKAE
ncbi:cAMP-responsive element modulator isoform X13 [Manis pentadactyla]|uniref:cAMP-responsive element modulator isoform X13 n=1 Tax=Manis pentadactyla TaxID=143292 RepID=UPI00255CC73E|nr:cAMP-responsive element modulator isoform X13 [Manis pentadactyla]